MDFFYSFLNNLNHILSLKLILSLKVLMQHLFCKHLRIYKKEVFVNIMHIIFILYSLINRQLYNDVFLETGVNKKMIDYTVFISNNQPTNGQISLSTGTYMFSNEAFWKFQCIAFWALFKDVLRTLFRTFDYERTSQKYEGR